MKKKVLVVNRDDLTIKVVTLALDRLKDEFPMSVITTTDGNSAGLLLEKNDFDLVISGVSIPEIDGLQLLRWAKEKNPKVFVVAYTSYVKDRNVIGAGFDLIIGKPCSNEYLTEKDLSFLK